MSIFSYYLSYPHLPFIDLNDLIFCFNSELILCFNAKKVYWKVWYSKPIKRIFYHLWMGVIPFCLPFVTNNGKGVVLQGKGVIGDVSTVKIGIWSDKSIKCGNIWFFFYIFTVKSNWRKLFSLVLFSFPITFLVLMVLTTIHRRVKTFLYRFSHFYFLIASLLSSISKRGDFMTIWCVSFFFFFCIFVFTLLPYVTVLLMITTMIKFDDQVCFKAILLDYKERTKYRKEFFSVNRSKIVKSWFAPKIIIKLGLIVYSI